ncbi:MAG: ABC transporter substrate-binding protein [Dialister sp.]|nr:ABC transporter substrate-binding protein [Dialister sp.]
MRKIYAALLAGVLCLGIAGCGSSENQPAGKGAVYTYKDQRIEVKAAPERIVMLTTPLLNMAYAVGGSSVGRPTTNNPIPEEAKGLPEIGHVQNINMESLVGLKPDLAIGETTQNKKLESLLQANKIPYVLITYDGINDNVPLMEFMGQIYGIPDKAKAVIDDYNARMKKVEEEAAAKQPVKVAILRATGKDVTAETPKSICASMAELLKMDNVVTGHDELKLDTKTVSYSLEQLSSDNPDVIFIVTMGKAEEINKKLDQEMRSNPAWAYLDAVRNNRVFFLPADLFLLNPGIRTPEAMQQLLNLAYKDM